MARSSAFGGEERHLQRELSLTSETLHLVNAERLALMKPSSYLINTARVDQKALARVLQGGESTAPARAAG
jgi:phosphoglycerate dehydrogenase-like enzyme